MGLIDIGLLEQNSELHQKADSKIHSNPGSERHIKMKMDECLALGMQYDEKVEDCVPFKQEEPKLEK